MLKFFSRSTAVTPDLNNDGIKNFILFDFISHFIDEEANDAKINKIIDCLTTNKVFFGGKYINEILDESTKPRATIEIYISFENIVNFLIGLSDCNKSYDGNVLLQQLTVELNINSKYNTRISPKSVYDINYINYETNRNITIYVVNDFDIIGKITNTDIEKNKFWYDLEGNIITSTTELAALQPSHALRASNQLFKTLNKPDDKLFEDIIIEIIKYIPLYISPSDILFDTTVSTNIDKLYINFIYTYPAIWFTFLIALQDYHTYHTLSYVYNEEIMATKRHPNKIINFNNLVTKIYINNFLNKYEISLNLDISKTIAFNISQTKTLEPYEEAHVRKLLLFYYKYKIFDFPYMYNFQKFIIDYGLLQVISPLKLYNERNPILSLNDEIDKLYTNGCSFADIINGNQDIPRDELKSLLEIKDNIIIFGTNINQGFIFSKEHLDRLIIESYKKTWLINCNQSYTNSFILLSLYVKISIMTDYYISYSDMFSLFNSNAQIYYIIRTEEILNKVAKFENYTNNMTLQEFRANNNVWCKNNSDAQYISKLTITSTINIPLAQERYEHFSTINDNGIAISTIFNKKLILEEKNESSSRIAKKSKH